MCTKTVSRETAASEAVIEAVSDREGVDPTELDRPLYDVIDPEGLDKLVDSGAPVEISFSYYGYQVTVSSNGDITLSE